jgi:DNA mismatch repair ATPase MutS
MEIDHITLQDLAIFNAEDEFSIFHTIDGTRTSRGKERLRKLLATPRTGLDDIRAMQDTLRQVIAHYDKWPMRISNGTIMVVERFYETVIDVIPANPNGFSTFNYKLLHGPDFSLVKYSTIHCFDVVRGMQEIRQLFPGTDHPKPLQQLLTRIDQLVNKTQLKQMEKYARAADMPLPQMLGLAHFFRYQYREEMLTLVQLFAELDAWYGMAGSMISMKLVFPTLVESDRPVLEVKGLYHLLLKKPVDYDVNLNKEKNFLFLTGANMAGKSTFIKAVGTAVFLAHTGMGVPAKEMSLSVFDGMLSNINVIDNISRGESYFFNEVQRIKATVTKVNDGRKWLILIDELFKGTNVEDAMKCSIAVIEGLLKMRNAVFILSTHLYEIGAALKDHPNILFNYFETTVNNDQLSFSYTLHEGISNDRLGYLILKREGVVKMLEDL